MRRVNGTESRALAFAALRLTLLPFLIRTVLQRSKVTILAYHAPAADVLDSHLGLLKRLYNIIPLAQYVDARETHGLRLPQRALIITLDDGHQSNYDLKAVLQKHNVPVTIFLCSGVIDTRRRFWFQHDAAADVVQSLKTLPDADRRAALRDTGFEEQQEFHDRQALSFAEVEELKTLADFQSHTVFHSILPRCMPARAESEITNSKLDLQARLGHEIYALAYPNGDYSEREVELAEKAGYRCALTLDRGFNTATTPAYKLRRICISDSADRHELIVKASGLWGAIRAVLG